MKNIRYYKMNNHNIKNNKIIDKMNNHKILKIILY